MYDRPPSDGASRVNALKRAVDIALTVAAHTEWLACRPMIAPILVPELNVPVHIRNVAANTTRLADNLGRTLTADTLLRHQDSDVVDAVAAVATKCRSFAHRWSNPSDTDTKRFNDDVAQLRHDIDQSIHAITA
jgi:hypothetical protein